jgi:Retrotransposon gag protein
MSRFVPRSTTPNSDNSDDLQNNRFSLLDMSLDENQAGPSTSTLDNQLASAVASHLHTLSIEQPADPTPEEVVHQVATNIINTLNAQYQASSSRNSSSNSPMTNMDHALNLIPTDVTNEQVAQITAIFNITAEQATNVASTHAPAMNVFATQTQTRTQTRTSTGATPGYGGGGGGRGGSSGHTPAGSPPSMPGRGGGGGSGSALGGLAQIPIPAAGNSLMGQSPGIYEGDRSKSKMFLEKFKIWRWLNRSHPTMANLANHVMMFCTHLIGPKVDGWARGRVNQLGLNITNSVINPNSEQVWNDFKVRFEEDFQDTSVKEDALHKLMNLRMQGDNLNTYNTMFNDVMSLAGFEEDALGTLVAYQ